MQPVQHINSVQEIMLSGGPDAGCVESTADGCLTLPACLWRDHDVKVVRNQKKWETSVVGPNEYRTVCLKSCICHPTSTPRSANIMLLGCSVTYIFPAVISAPLLLMGSILKKIAFCIDEEANQYNELAVDLVNHYSYQDEKSAEQKYKKNNNEKANLDLQINFLNQKLKEFQEVTVTGTGTIAREIKKRKNQLVKVDDEIKLYERRKDQNLQMLKKFNDKINNSEKSPLL